MDAEQLAREALAMRRRLFDDAVVPPAVDDGMIDYLDWALEDPAGKGVESVRPIRDEIERRIRGLLSELLPAR